MSIWHTPEREQLRKTVRAFAEREVLPNVDEWERSGMLPRELHLRAGEAGLLGAGLPESVGGGGGDGADALETRDGIPLVPLALSHVHLGVIDAKGFDV